MSEPGPELDELLRSKFLSLGETVDAPLDTEYERRIVAQLQLQSARRGNRTRRLRTWAAGTGMLAVAATLVFAWLARDAHGPQVRQTQVCAWGAAEMTFVAGPEGKRELALGRAGHIVLAPGAEAIAKQDATCALTVELVRGSLAAELGNLRPGSLRVQTGLGDVQVRGTTFSVDLKDGLHVVLLSGAVELVDDGQVALTMSPGNALRRSARRAPPAMSEASAEEARLVSNLLSKRALGRAGEQKSSASEPADSADIQDTLEANNAPPAGEPVRSGAPGRSSSLLGEAEAARRRGDTQRARALYTQAEQLSHADAEVAFLRHAGFEIEASDPATAEKLLAEHRRRFPHSRLAAEAAWLGVRSLQATGDRAATRAAAQVLVKHFPGTPQARAAERLLEQP